MVSGLNAVWMRGVSWAGLAAGPGAWMINQQANYAAVPWICAHRINVVPAVAIALALVAAGGALLSWRRWRIAPGDPAGGEGGTPAHFLAGLSILLGALFAVAILTQGAAAFVLDGCER